MIDVQGSIASRTKILASANLRGAIRAADEGKEDGSSSGLLLTPARDVIGCPLEVLSEVLSEEKDVIEAED